MTAAFLHTAHLLDAHYSRAQAPPVVDLRGAFRAAAASTWVVTGSGHRGPVGFTAISVISVSVAPPIVSFNISKNSSSLVTLAQTQRAALHLLGADQTSLADRFARDRSQRFVHDAAWGYDDHGLPEIRGVASRLITRIEDLVDAGDSFIAVARVEHTTAHGRHPLVHHAGGYHSLDAHPSAVPTSPIGA